MSFAFAHARRPLLGFPPDLAAGLVSVVAGGWLVGSTWGTPLVALGAAFVLVGSGWVAAGVRSAA